LAVVRAGTRAVLCRSTRRYRVRCRVMSWSGVPVTGASVRASQQPPPPTTTDTVDRVTSRAPSGYLILLIASPLCRFCKITVYKYSPRSRIEFGPTALYHAHARRSPPLSRGEARSSRAREREPILGIGAEPQWGSRGHSPRWRVRGQSPLKQKAM